MKKKLEIIIISKKLKVPPSKLPITLKKEKITSPPAYSSKLFTVMKQKRPNCTVQNLQDYSRLDSSVQGQSILDVHNISSVHKSSYHENYVDENTTTCNDVYKRIVEELAKKRETHPTVSPRLLRKRRTSYENKDTFIFHNSLLKNKMKRGTGIGFYLSTPESEFMQPRTSFFYMRNSMPTSMAGSTCGEKSVFPSIHGSEDTPTVKPRQKDIKPSRKQMINDLRNSTSPTKEENKLMTIRLKDKAESNLVHPFTPSHPAKMNYLVEKMKNASILSYPKSYLHKKKKNLSTPIHKRSTEIKVQKIRNSNDEYSMRINNLSKFKEFRRNYQALAKRIVSDNMCIVQSIQDYKAKLSECISIV